MILLDDRDKRVWTACSTHFMIVTSIKQKDDDGCQCQGLDVPSRFSGAWGAIVTWCPSRCISKTHISDGRNQSLVLWVNRLNQWVGCCLWQTHKINNNCKCWTDSIDDCICVFSTVSAANSLLRRSVDNFNSVHNSTATNSKHTSDHKGLRSRVMLYSQQK